MRSDNKTFLGTREDPKDLKKEGVVGDEALALHNYALVQLVLGLFAALPRLAINTISPTQLTLPPPQP